MHKYLIYTLILVITTVACKSSKITNADSNIEMSAKNVIKNHYANTFNKQTVTARLKVKYEGKSHLPGVTVSLRMKTDETIWLSISKLGFPIGKALITPDKVSYYEKINKTYFEGDFALLSNWLGTALDFEKVQNLILGQALLNLKNEKFLIDYQQHKYVLKPKKESDLYDILFLINPDNFKISSQEISQKDENKTLTINYKGYAAIENELFPKQIHIAASDTKNSSTVDVNYRSVVFNRPLNFPFSIPNNYKRIVLK